MVFVVVVKLRVLTWGDDPALSEWATYAIVSALIRRWGGGEARHMIHTHSGEGSVIKEVESGAMGP